MKTFLMLMKRELWEHPAFYVAPMVVTAVMILGFAAEQIFTGSDFLGPANFVQVFNLIDEASRPKAYSVLVFLGFLAYNLILVFVIGFYLMDCLYAERKDRSILFWKSLPVSDTTTVISKIATAMFTIPGVTLVVYLLSWIVFSVVLTLIVWVGGGSAWDLVWKPMPFLEVMGVVSYTALVQSFWFLPFIGWVALASAWARRMPFLWVVLVPLAIVIVETFIFRSEKFLALIGERFQAVLPLAFSTEIFEDVDVDLDDMRFDHVGSLLDIIDPTPLLSNIQFWGGIVVGSLMIAAAVFLRRYRDET